MTSLLLSKPSAEQLWEQRLELATAFRAASMHGFNEGIDNHFSAVVHGTDDRFLLNPYGPDWSELTARDLLTIDLDGRLVEGDGSWERTAFVIHRAVHRARTDARCVLHTHMPYATALSMTETGLQTRASQNAMLFHDRIVRLSYAGLADADEEGARIADAVVADVSVVMLDNHGVLVIGSSIPDAWQKLYFLERALHGAGARTVDRLAVASCIERGGRAHGAPVEGHAWRRCTVRRGPTLGRPAQSGLGDLTRLGEHGGPRRRGRRRMDRPPALRIPAQDTRGPCRRSKRHR